MDFNVPSISSVVVYSDRNACISFQNLNVWAVIKLIYTGRNIRTSVIYDLIFLNLIPVAKS